MGKFIKPGRCVILLQGRFAGKKGLVIKTNDDGTKDRKFPHALVIGIERHPRRVTRRMGVKRIQKRTTIKPFVKYVNLNHIMPTRYVVGTAELDVKDIVKDDKLSAADKKTELKKELKKELQEKYRGLPAATKTGDKTSQLRFFFKKLRF